MGSYRAIVFVDQDMTTNPPSTVQECAGVFTSEKAALTAAEKHCKGVGGYGYRIQEQSPEEMNQEFMEILGTGNQEDKQLLFELIQVEQRRQEALNP